MSIVVVPGNEFLSPTSVPFSGLISGGDAWAIKGASFTRSEGDPLTSYDVTKWSQTTSGTSSISYGSGGVTFTTGTPANDYAYISSVHTWAMGEWQVSFQSQSNLAFAPAGSVAHTSVYAARIQWVVSATEYLDIYQTIDAALGKTIVVKMVRSGLTADLVTVPGNLSVYTVKVRRWADKMQVFINSVLVLTVQGWTASVASVHLGVGTVSPAIVSATFYNFLTFNTVLFGSVPAGDVTFINDGYIRGTTPQNVPGTVDVSVVIPGSVIGTCSQIFTYLQTPSLQIPSNALPRLSVVDDETLV